MAPTDYPLTPCVFEKWVRYDSLPIEQACFVLLGQEPPSVQVLRHRTVQYQERPGATWEKPSGFDDMLALLENSIKTGTVVFRQDVEHSYMTKHVGWPELVRWAESKGYVVPPELLSVGAADKPTIEPAETLPTESIALAIKHEEAPQPTPSDESNTGWSLRRPTRFQGYGKPLHDLLRVASIEGKPCPKAREVLDAWKINRPPEVLEVTNEELKYEDANGGVKVADLDAIRQTIKRMVE